jgi:hypothetical protein
MLVTIWLTHLASSVAVEAVQGNRQGNINRFQWGFKGKEDSHLTVRMQTMSHF